MPQACLGKTEYRNFHAVTWQLISHYGGQAAAESNHQCQGEDQFHAMEPKKEGVAKADSKKSIFESGVWIYIFFNW